jgi:hypothetical protein
MEIMRCAILAVPVVAVALGVGAMAGAARAQSVTTEGTRTLVWSNGDTFTGAFRDGLPNGPGTFRSADGEEHRGEWRDGCLLSDRGARIAVLTRLSDCPPPPPAKPRRPKRLPHEDFFR